MFKILQKLQSKIKNPEGGFIQMAIGAVLTAVLTGIGVTVGGLAVKGITYGILVVAIFTFANTISGVFIGFGRMILNWGIQGPFGTLSISMTNPANNRIIDIGWTLLRDLTNMFFILGLAYIGLATALNFASFNTKKTFTTLILVALLINFTPVICGLIVDGSNIIMNFFLSEVNYDSIEDSYKQYQASLPPLTERGAVDDIGPSLWRHTITGIYSILAGGVLTIFGAILLMRHFIIWLLVILSPFAFFCRIFDFSKQWYTKWWSYFVSWSFIGIPAAFFLYLANHLLVLAKTHQVPAGNPADQLGATLAPYFVAVVFMVIALITTLKIKTAGSSLIMNTANKIAGKVKAMPALIKTKVAKPMGEKVGAIAGVATAGGLAALGAGYKKSRESGQGRVTSALAGARNWAKQRGGLTKEGAKEGLKFKEKQREGMLLGAEKLGIVKPGYYEEERAKRLDTEAETKRLSHLDRDRQEEMLKRYLGKRVKTDADMKVIMALERNKAANQIPLTDNDVNLIGEFGYMDPKAIKEVSKALPYRAHELDPAKYKKEQDDLIDKGIATAGPDAETKARDKMIKDKIQGMSATDFTKYLQVGNLNPLDPNPVKATANKITLENMTQHFTLAQIKDYGRKAPAEAKEIIRNFFDSTINPTIGTPGTPAVAATPGTPANLRGRGGTITAGTPPTPAIPATPGTGIFAGKDISETARLLAVKKQVLSPDFY